MPPNKWFGTLARGAIRVVIGLGNAAETDGGACHLGSDIGSGARTDVDDFAAGALEHRLLQRHRARGEERHRHGGRTVGLDAAAVAGGVADTDLAAAWLNDGVAPNGQSGRAFRAGAIRRRRLSSDVVRRRGELRGSVVYAPVQRRSFGGAGLRPSGFASLRLARQGRLPAVEPFPRRCPAKL